MLCKICAGTGEIITDWDLYLHGRDGQPSDDEPTAECQSCFGTGLDRELFDAWLDDLSESVIQGEYGYESGEFEVYPGAWEPLYREGITPTEAFKRALDAAADARRERDEERKANWARIQAEDARLIASNNPVTQ